MPVTPVEKIWMNGKLVNWADAKIHVLSHVVHYGSSWFEGIRCYETKKGPAIFRLDKHLERLYDSVRIYHAEIPYTKQQLEDAIIETIRANKLRSCYIRPIAFYGFGQLGVSARGNPVETVLMCWPWGTYLGEEAMRSGVRAKISTWQRIPANVIPHASKATGVYLNSMLAVSEAQRAGYDEAIMLTPDGKVADGPGETIFVVSRGKLFTPDLSTGILHGITRDSVITIARELGIEVVEKDLIRTDLYLADEVFMCGTAAEVTPVRSVDDQEIGVGDLTREIQRVYLDVAHGRTDRFAAWRELVPVSASPAA